MLNSKRLVLNVTKVETQDSKIKFLLSNNQKKKPIWLETNSGFISKFDVIRKVRSILMQNLFPEKNNFENIRITFNQEYYIFSAAPSDEKDWAEFRMPIEISEMKIFFDAIKDLRIENINNSYSWSDITNHAK